MSPLPKESGKLNVAVIEGFHPFNVPQWHAMFRALEGVHYFQQTIDNWAADWGNCRKDYDVALFYNMNMDMKASPFADAIDKALRELGDTKQGLVVLHHAILSYPDNPVWSEIVGIKDRAFDYHVDQDLTVEIANESHPIAKDLRPWPLHDETYTMADAGEGSEILFTAQHPKSMKTLGWTRTHRNTRVFCFQPGHDNHAWENVTFREVLLRGIRWAAGKL